MSIRHHSTLLAAAIAGAACTSQGAFQGDVVGPEPHGTTSQSEPPPVDVQPIAFVWNSNDGGTSGEIATNLPDGEAFTGTYLSFSPALDVGSAQEFYDAWYRDWDVPPSSGKAWRHYPVTDYLVMFGGEVLATLHGDRGTRMRCHFEVLQAEYGLRSGGRGTCQLSTGEIVEAHVPPQ